MKYRRASFFYRVFISNSFSCRIDKGTHKAIYRFKEFAYKASKNNYADDFVIFSENKNRLKTLLLRIGAFLHKELALELHPNKVSIKTLVSGVDFLGWIHFSDHRILRTATKKTDDEKNTDKFKARINLFLSGAFETREYF